MAAPWILPIDDLTKHLLAEKKAHQVQRQKQQGLGKGIISAEVKGCRFVVVGNTVFRSTKWKTFQDFLWQYFIDRLGTEWCKREHAKPPNERHIILRWYQRGMADIGRLSTPHGADALMRGPMTGSYQAFINLAYNLYLIEHNASGKDSKSLVDSFVNKLKSERTDDFVGKLFETYGAAAFLKAGFTLEYEDEADNRSSHVEFVATYPATGKKFSVEVKTRNRSPTEEGAIDELKRLRVGIKLNKALGKAAAYTRVVMIEVNVPDTVVDTQKGWPKAALAQIRDAEKTNPPDGSEKPSAYVIVTNHAFHSNLENGEGGVQVLATGCRISDFGPDVGFSRLKDVLISHERHREMFALVDSMREHYEIPATFDGEIPEFAFQLPKDVPRLKFGETYLVPMKDGREIPGRLYEASVIESEKLVYGVYDTAEGHLVCTSPISDFELAAWARHPETFFGEVRPVNGKGLKNWLELALFMYETYKKTPRELLLEWFGNSSDIEWLRTLPQEELAILYCERFALGSYNPVAA